MIFFEWNCLMNRYFFILMYKIRKDEWSLLQKWEHISFQAKEEPHFYKLTFFTHCRFHSLILDIGRPSFQVVNTTHKVSFSIYSSISSHLNLYNNTKYTRQGLVTYNKWILSSKISRKSCFKWRKIDIKTWL